MEWGIVFIVFHVSIQQDSQSGTFLDKSGEYTSVKGLIEYHVNHGVPLSSAGEKLLVPISKYDQWTVHYSDIELEDIRPPVSGGCYGNATDKRNGERVTAKTFSGERAKSINEFLLEAEVLKRCHNSNVVR